MKNWPSGGESVVGGDWYEKGGGGDGADFVAVAGAGGSEGEEAEKDSLTR